jgi:dCMP deaminase|tara:strand:+ start:171 stop:698 length:528 start_codon:yes stop_codon:yes gene_type:complete
MNSDQKTIKEVSNVTSNINSANNLQKQLNDDLTNFIDNNCERLSWDSYFMSISVLAAKRSSCSRLHVGCVIVKNNRILTSGYNGFLRGAPHVSRVANGHEQFTVHAEQNAICDAAFRGVPLENSIAYVTHCPCINCMKLLIAAGISEIKYLHDYKNDELATTMVLENKIKLIKLG